MPSRDTVVFRITKELKDDLDRWKEKISDSLGVKVETISYKKAEKALRESAKNGSVTVKRLNEIMLGKE